MKDSIAPWNAMGKSKSSNNCSGKRCWPKRYWKSGKMPFYFHLISREKLFFPLFSSHSLVTLNHFFTRSAEEKNWIATQKVSRDFYSFYDGENFARMWEKECFLDICSFNASGVAFCCVLAFALLIHSSVEEFSTLYAVVHNKQSKAFLQLGMFSLAVFIAAELTQGDEKCCGYVENWLNVDRFWLKGSFSVNFKKRFKKFQFYVLIWNFEDIKNRVGQLKHRGI